MSQTKINFGYLGQSLAVKYLKIQGYRIVAENFYCRWGEIDIVAIDKDTLVFVEVRTRATREFLSPIESITPKKIATLIRTGLYYIQTHPGLPDSWRLDCLGVIIQNSTRVSFDLRQDCWTKG